MHMKITFNKRPDQVLGPLIVPEDPRIFEDAETSTEGDRSTQKHYKLMCNVMVDGKRKNRNSRLTKDIVEACAADGIHLTDAFGQNGEVWNCFKESQSVRVGDVVHMYYGDLKYGDSKHFVGEVLSSYEKFSDDVPLTAFPKVEELWANHCPHRNATCIFCRVDWEEVAMTPEDEYMLKNPGKNGFKVQGTILRVH